MKKDLYFLVPSGTTKRSYRSGAFIVGFSAGLYDRSDDSVRLITHTHTHAHTYRYIYIYIYNLEIGF